MTPRLKTPGNPPLTMTGKSKVGSFTADSTSQDLTMHANGFGNIHYNAILVTEVVPEPASTVLLGVAGLGLLARGRR